jgi:transcriptional regulator with PAS, ATPase and Fis domain
MREDLYYRLNVYTVELPPLRYRLEDLPLLVEHFIQEFNREHSKKVQGMGQGCLDTLRAHTWPGNVRELRNVVQRAVIKCHSPMLSAGDVPPEVDVQCSPKAHFTILLGSSICEVERELIVRTLGYVRGETCFNAQCLGCTARRRRSLAVLGVLLSAIIAAVVVSFSSVRWWATVCACGE